MRKAFSVIQYHLLHLLLLSFLLGGLYVSTQESALCAEMNVHTAAEQIPLRSAHYLRDRAGQMAIAEETDGLRTVRIVSHKEKKSGTGKTLTFLGAALSEKKTSVPGGFGTLAMLPYRLGALSGGSTIISYIHDQDGQKDSPFLFLS